MGGSAGRCGRGDAPALPPIHFLSFDPAILQPT